MFLSQLRSNTLVLSCKAHKRHGGGFGFLFHFFSQTTKTWSRVRIGWILLSDIASYGYCLKIFPWQVENGRFRREMTWAQRIQRHQVPLRQTPCGPGACVPTSEVWIISRRPILGSKWLKFGHIEIHAWVPAGIELRINGSLLSSLLCALCRRKSNAISTSVVSAKRPIYPSAWSVSCSNWKKKKKIHRLRILGAAV